MAFRWQEDSSGYKKVAALSDVSGLTEWVDYLPIQTVAQDAGQENRTSATGYIETNALSDTTGLQAWVDYTPVYIVTGRTVPWECSANGYIPVYAAAGSLGGASFPAASGWNYGTDGDGATYVLTDGTGGAGTTGLEPVLDVISNTNRRLTGADFSEDGLTMLACSLDGNIATFSLTTAFDPSTATQTGSSHTGHTTCTGIRFNEDGTYVTWLQAVDRFYIMPLATAYVVESTDTPSATSIPKLTLIGYSNSHDPIHAMNKDGTGIWTYGVTAAGVYNLAYMPLSTPYDFSSTGTLVVNTTTSHGNIVTTPWGGSLWVQSDGLAVTIHGNGVPEIYATVTMNAANDPTDETGDYSWVEDT